ETFPEGCPRSVDSGSPWRVLVYSVGSRVLTPAITRCLSAGFKIGPQSTVYTDKRLPMQSFPCSARIS
ncbi:MAG: hypothetical protein ACXV2A_06845, partial [Halobacteriota archaeon]